jgi:tetratricopeptide (TPR) repeat protein
MIVMAIALFAGPVAPAATDEKFTVGAAEMNNPCHVKIEGKPSENPPVDCATAISAAKTARERSILYFAWAYSLNEANAALQALPNLDKAVALAPNFTNARHERGYTLGDLGYYERALVDSNRHVELTSNFAPAYAERAFARHRLADFEGALADRLKAIELGNPDQDSAIGVVEELMWLGRYEEASKRLAMLPVRDEEKTIRSELAQRMEYKSDGSEAKRCEMDQSLDDPSRAQGLIDDCTWAFDHEPDPAKRAEFLTVRGTVKVVALQQANASLADLQIAVALDPKTARHHINYGFALANARHSWAARNQFDIALATSNLPKKEKAMALAGRGQANANLGEMKAARNDTKTSLEIQPMEPNLWLAADLAFADGDKESAKKLWLAAYRMGARSDALLASLKSVGVDDPEKEPK